MKKKVKILSNTNLLPGNPKWRELGEVFDLSFGEYQEGPSYFAHGAIKEDFVVWSVFLEDLFSLDFMLSNNQLSAEHVESCLDSYFGPMSAQLKEMLNPVYIFYSSGNFTYNPVDSCRSSGNFALVEKLCLNYLQKLNESFDNSNLVLMDKIFGRLGFDNCFNTRNFYTARSRMSLRGLGTLAETVRRVLFREIQARKKILILDCDNTLWGGVVGDLGVQGISLGEDGVGAAYKDFQAAIRLVAEKGIILAVSSKNNEKDVFEVFESHQEMLLQKEHITSFEVNWGLKSNSVQKICEELDIGADSVVFWDDSSFERAEVRSALPEVTVVEPSDNISDWPKQLLDMDEFYQFSQTSDDLKKADQYKSRKVFNESFKKALDEVGFLKSIEMKVSGFELSESNVQRAAQLCMKTNQFNLLSLRHSVEDINLLRKNNSIIKLFNLEDKFGNHGIIGEFILEWKSGSKFFFLNTFILSCRAIKRKVESFMLNEAVSILQEKGEKVLVAGFLSNGKNSISENFLSDHGFLPITTFPEALRDNEFASIEKLYWLDLNTYKPFSREIFSEE